MQHLQCKWKRSTTIRKLLTPFQHSELLRQLTDIAGSIPEGKGQLARAYFKLAVLQEERGRLEESRTYKALAEDLKSELVSQSEERPFTEDEYMKLCVWMLW